MGGNLRGNFFKYCLKTWQNALTYQTVTHITSPHINPELLLVSSMDYMYHVDALLPTDVGCGYFDAICTERCLICEKHLRDKQLISGLLKKQSTKNLPWWVISRPWTRLKCKGHSNCSWSTLQTLLRPTGKVTASCLLLIPGSSVSCSRVRSSISGVRTYLDLPPSAIIGFTIPVSANRR